jgi:TonB family protein
MKRAIYVCLAVCCLLQLCQIAAAQSGEPVMVNPAVQASRLIEKVDPVYPEAARQAGIKGTVVLLVTIDEHGNVSQANVPIGDPDRLLYPAAIDAVKQWRYAPAMNEGRAVSVRTFVSVPFGVPPTIEFSVDANGKIIGPDIASGDIKNLEIAVSTAPQISYAILEKALKELQSRGASHLRLSSMAYVFKAGQLFYQLHDQANAFLSQNALNVQPPELDMDLNYLALKAAAGGVEKARLISTPFGTIVRPGPSYMVGINAAGEIVFVERNAATDAPDQPEIEAAIRQAHVKRPAYLDGKAVPVAITIAMPVL